MRNFCGKKGFPIEKFSENTAARPNINSGGVEVADKEKLGCPVISHGDVFGKVNSFGPFLLSWH